MLKNKYIYFILLVMYALTPAIKRNIATALEMIGALREKLSLVVSLPVLGTVGATDLMIGGNNSTLASASASSHHRKFGHLFAFLLHARKHAGALGNIRLQDVVAHSFSSMIIRISARL